MTTEELARLKALCDAATPGPWRFDERAKGTEESPAIIGPGPAFHPGESPVFCGRPFWSYSDAEFVAAARTALPALLAEVERLEAAKDAAHESMRRAEQRELAALAECDELRAALAALAAAPEGHAWAKHERWGWSVCSRCGMVRNYDRETRCKGAPPVVRPRAIPLCERCSHKATSHRVDDEERRECSEFSCSCQQFEAPPNPPKEHA